MKALGAFGLGLLSFGLFMFIGESVGVGAAFATLLVYIFLCQFLLSRGHADAHRGDWPVMLALDTPMLAIAIFVFLTEGRSVFENQIPGMVLSTCGATYAGAVAAAMMARRMVRR